jgi:hypothetical protein
VRVAGNANILEEWQGDEQEYLCENVENLREPGRNGFGMRIVRKRQLPERNRSDVAEYGEP